jgi:hypothetical protein
LQRPGESDLQRLGWVTMLKAAPGQIQALATRVPPSHVRFEQDTAAVTCTCDFGLPLLVPPAQSTRCKCGRVFLNIGGEVRVCKTKEAA